MPRHQDHIVESICDILTLERTLYSISVNTQKKAFELIAETIASTISSLRANDIFDKLVSREFLGSTVIGHGVALPHARFEQLDQTIGCFLLLKEQIDFSVHHTRVDMIFALLIPASHTQEHLDLLASIANFFHQESIRQSLREATSKNDLFNKLCRG